MKMKKRKERKEMAWYIFFFFFLKSYLLYFCTYLPSSLPLAPVREAKNGEKTW